jgi:hypothetical protein
MKQSRRVFIPAIVVAVVSMCLIIYALSTMQPHSGEHPMGGPPPEGNSVKGIFNNLGNMAIICGAVSYLWFIFKKRLTSPSKPVKKMAKTLIKVHHYMGWAALILTIVHGAYYLTDVENNKYLTGIAGFLLLLALAGYGWLIKRVRNKFMKTSHLVLSNLWLIALLVHAGGFFILVTGGTLLVWAFVWIVELAIKQKEVSNESHANSVKMAKPDK